MAILRYGDMGPEVEYLQLALTRAGYAPGPIDGIFGRRTYDALVRFQRDSGLAADGIVGKLTWTRLYPFLSGYTVHVVQAGDTFYKLAKRYGSSAAAITTANPAADPGNLLLGSSLVIPLDFILVPFVVSMSYALLLILADGLTARYPFIRSETQGQSVMGKRLIVLSMGVGDKEVFYNASHHANEWITTSLVLRYLEDYAKAYTENTEIGGYDARGLYRKSTLYLMPLVNPDGVDLVAGMLDKDDPYYLQASAFAEYYPSIPFPSGWKANIGGVDLNLGYPANWESAKRIKFAQGYTRPGPRDYVGSAPLAEPENRAVAALTEAHAFRLTLSYHTQGEVIFWKYLDHEPENSRAIADAFAAVSGYEVENTPYASGFAGYKDWFIQQYDLPGYTIEAGRGSNPLPLSDLPGIYRDNIGILTLGMELS